MIEGPVLLRLMAWLSPSFPVGGYTYSHGIEYAVEAGLVHDANSLAGWIEGIMLHGGGRIDADLFREAWKAVRDDDRFNRAILDLVFPVSLSGFVKPSREPAPRRILWSPRRPSDRSRRHGQKQSPPHS